MSIHHQWTLIVDEPRRTRSRCVKCNIYRSQRASEYGMHLVWQTQYQVGGVWRKLAPPCVASAANVATSGIRQGSLFDGGVR